MLEPMSKDEGVLHGRKLVVGVDIGGTDIKLGLVDEEGQILTHTSTPLVRDRAGIADISVIYREIDRLIQNKPAREQLAGVAIACPGILDTDRGIVKRAVNLGWENIDLTGPLREQLKLPVHLINDATAATLGVRDDSISYGVTSFLFLCIGTGIGASLVIDNELFQGGYGPVLDIGHTSVIPNGVACDCGNRGCLEKYVSATSLVRRVKAELPTTSSLLHEYIEVNEKLDSKLVHRAALHGDVYANQVFRDMGFYLGICIVNSVHLFGINTIIIGGGVSQAGDVLLAPTRQVVAKRIKHTEIHIQATRLPTLAGVMGAATHLFNRLKGEVIC